MCSMYKENIPEKIPDAVTNVYFLGIGGIGMSALARYFKARGYRVGGYDRTPSKLTEKMEKEEGITVNYRDDPAEIAPEFRNPGSTLVVYTPAIPADNRQKIYFGESGHGLYKRSEVLGLISRQWRAICVAGTHGKTTVSTMTAFLLDRSKVGCNAFLGGIAENFGSNLVLNPDSDYVVIEADEFDRSFLQLNPELAVITSMDNDHMDIYGNRANLTEAFEEFALRVKKGGKIYLKKGLTLEKREVAGYYGVGPEADCYSDNLRIDDGHYVFDYHGRKNEMCGLVMGIPGRLNVENATAAITLALEVGVTESEIRAALPLFRGVERRFSIRANRNGRLYIDDYAHHPREIEATLLSIREMWPGQPLTIAFQPHLYSRTRDFYREFAKSLSLADRVILLDIYPARELPIPGINSGIILKLLTVPGVVLSKEALLDFVSEEFRSGILVTAGAGDIDRLVKDIAEKVNS